MATNPPGPAGASLLDTLAANRRQLGIGLVVLGLALAAIPIVFLVRQEWDSAREIIIWGRSSPWPVSSRGRSAWRRRRGRTCRTRSRFAWCFSSSAAWRGS